MKKKVLYGLTLALFGSVAMGTLQSCKDDLSDLSHKVDFNQKDLKGQLTKLQSNLDGVRENHKKSIDSLANVLKRVGNEQDQDSIRLDKVRKDLDALTAGMGDLSIIDQIKKTIDELLADGTIGNGGNYDEEIGKINEAIIAINSRIDLLPDLTERVEKLETYSSALDTIIPGYSKLNETVIGLTAQYQAQQQALADVKNELEELNKSIYGTGGLSEQMSQYYNALNDKIDEKYNELAADNKELWESIYGPQGIQEQMSQFYQANKDAIEALGKDQQDLWNDVFGTGGLSDQMSQYYQANKDAIEANAADTKELWESVFGENGLSTLMSQYYNANKAEIDELRESNNELWESIYGEGGLTTQISQYYNANRQAIEDLAADMNEQLGKILVRMDSLITGILIQGTANPVFGNFSLPLGIKSNMLFNWYGYNMSDIEQFPSNKKMYAYNKEAANFNVDESAVIDVNPEFLGDVNLGRVYLTINPAGHTFNNSFKLETTSGRALPFEVTVKKSNDELSWGYSRAEKVAGNGFYAADVVISGDNDALAAGVNATQIKIDDNLKSAVKEVLSDRSKRSALNLLKAVYGQMSGMLPYYGVRYDWNADGNDYTVVSNYDLAVASAKPLSYQFFYDKSITKKLPTIGHINNIINELKGKFHFEFEPISFDNITITLPPIDFSDVKAEGPDLKIELNVGDVVIRDEEGNEIGRGKPEITLDGVENINTQIAESMQKTIDQLTGKISDWTGEANDKISAQLQEQLAPIAKQINDMVGSINGQLDDMIDDMGNKFQPVFDRVNQLVDLYNKVAGKINNFLDDPNHYLQVAMFYKGGNLGMGVLSNSKKSPTVFTGNGKYVGLYASSYTGELVAPAFKKYVAVTNVYNADGSAYDGAEAAMAKVNGKNNFNVVMDGNTIRYSIAKENIEKGKIYEIVYQGLDFHGVTSTQKFYITVK